MRLLLINYEYPPLGGGAGQATASLAREFAAAGHETRVLTSQFRGQPASEEIDGYTIDRVRVLRRRPDRCSPVEMCTFLASAAAALCGRLRGWRPAFTIAFFGIPCGPLALQLRWGSGVPYLVSLRGGDVPGFQPYDLALHHRIFGPAIRAIWSRAAGVIANSHGLQQLARQFAPELPVPVIPNGVDSLFFHPSWRNPANALPQAPLGSDLTPSGQPAGRRPPGSPVRLLFVGRLVYQKGLDLLMEALAGISQPLALRCVGDGDQRAALEQAASRLGRNIQTEFLGWRDRAQIAEIYREADLFVFPSRDEGMPNVVLEAMASGLPVLATAISGSEELVRDGVNGRLVPSGDTAALGEALRSLLADPTTLSDMGRASREIVEREYTWKQVAACYLETMHKHLTVAGPRISPAS